MVLRCWLGFASGGYVGHGETYWNEEEELWWAKGGKLHGESAPRIAFLRRVIEETPGYGLSPLADCRIGSFLMAMGIKLQPDIMAWTTFSSILVCISPVFASSACLKEFPDRRPRHLEYDH